MMMLVGWVATAPLCAGPAESSGRGLKRIMRDRGSLEVCCEREQSIAGERVR